MTFSGVDLEDNVYESTFQQQSTSSNFNIPTLSGIAGKVAQVEDLKLDKKQYIRYEIICWCNFKNDHLIDPRLSSKTSLFSDVSCNCKRLLSANSLPLPLFLFDIIHESRDIFYKL